MVISASDWCCFTSHQSSVISLLFVSLSFSIPCINIQLVSLSMEANGIWIIWNVATSFYNLFGASLNWLESCSVVVGLCMFYYLGFLLKPYATGICVIHSSIHSPSILALPYSRWQGWVEAIPAAVWQEARNTLDRLPVYCWRREAAVTTES